jgi:hypothetical protein
MLSIQEPIQGDDPQRVADAALKNLISFIGLPASHS